jgi:quercetin dioxygenase-like cupin family protein
MAFSESIKNGAALGLMAAISISPTAALASPGSGVSSEVYVTGTLVGDNQQNSDRVKFQTKDNVSTRVQKLTFAPGSYSGWHHHPGIVIVTVQSGTVKLMHSDCSFHEYTAGSPHGSAFIEGEHRVHQASSVNGATVIATYVAPYASPPVFRVEDPVPFCAQGQ